MYLRSKKVDIMAFFGNRVAALKKEYADVFEDPNLLGQVAVRMANPGCRQCLAEGECVHCGCKSPDLFFERSMECSGMHWFAMIPSESWKTYAEQSGINVDDDYIKQIRKYGKIVEFK